MYNKNNIELSKKILDKFKSKISCIFVEPIQGGFPTMYKPFNTFVFAEVCSSL